MSETPADPEQNPSDQPKDQGQPKQATPEGFPFDPNQDPPQEEPAVRRKTLRVRPPVRTGNPTNPPLRIPSGPRPDEKRPVEGRRTQLISLSLISMNPWSTTWSSCRAN